MPIAAADSPVSLIEGIGPQIASRLEDCGVYTVFDLLRAAPPTIHAMVSDRASLEQAAGWRAAAGLLQIRAMTADWAEVLVRGGVTSPAAICSRPHGELARILADGHQAGVSADEPDAATIEDMRVDAAVLAHTGAVDVTLRDDAGEPIAEAEARVGDLTARSDSRGRFRITRIRLGQRQTLVVSHPGFETLAHELSALHVDHREVGVLVLPLERVAAGSAAPQVSARLSEYDGDELPALSADSFTTEARGASELREGDLLVLRLFYADETTAQLTSKFLDWEEGQFIVVSFRVPLTDLPAGAALGDHFFHRSGAFSKVRLHATRLDIFKAMRRARKQMSSRPLPETATEREASLREYVRLLHEARTHPVRSDRN